MKKVVLKIFKLILVWLTSLAALLGLMLASACIPNDMIKDNIAASAVKLMPEEPHPPLVYGLYHSVQDNYADIILFR